MILDDLFFCLNNNKKYYWSKNFFISLKMGFFIFIEYYQISKMIQN